MLAKPSTVRVALEPGTARVEVTKCPPIGYCGEAGDLADGMCMIELQLNHDKTEMEAYDEETDIYYHSLVKTDPDGRQERHTRNFAISVV